MSARRAFVSHALETACLSALLALGGCRGVLSTEHAAPVPPPDPANCSYRIGNATVALVGGIAEIPAAPGASSKIRTQIWREATPADLNGDGNADAVVILTQETGGSGTFFYLAAALVTAQGCAGTEGLFLGDRIVPESVAVRDGIITVRYLTHGPTQSFAETPTVEEIRDVVLSADGRTLVESAPASPAERPDR